MPTDVNEPPTRELLDRIRKGDRQAGNLFCERYGPRVLGIVRRYLRNRPRRNLETEDLVQSSLREVFVHLDRFAYRGEGAFIKWLGMVVETKIHSTVRHWSSSLRNREREVPAEISRLPDDGPSPSQEVRRIEANDHLYRAINRLPPRERRVVINRMILELPWAAIARADDCTVHALQMRLSRAKKRLAKELRKLEMGI